MNANVENYDLTVSSASVPAAPSSVEFDDDGAAMIVDLTTRTTSYCSLVANTEEEKTTLFNAMNNPDKRLKDCINEVINVKDVFVEVVQCQNKETGEVTTAPRVVLIDTAGIGYQCVSKGIFGALKKLFAVYGEPQNWASPLSLKIKLITLSADKNVLTFEVARNKK